VTVGDSWWQLV